MSLVKALTELMERKGYNQSHVARAIGKSPATISTYLKGIYAGDVKNLMKIFRTLSSGSQSAIVPYASMRSTYRPSPRVRDWMSSAWRISTAKLT